MKKPGARSLFTGLLPLFVLAHCGHHLPSAILVPLLPFIRDDFGLDYTKAGLVVSAFTLSYGICQLPGGWLADRIGSRTVAAIGVSGVALFGFLVGISSTYIMMMVFLVLLGVSGGGYHPAASSAISASVDSKSRGKALGLHLIGGTASHFAAPLLAVAVATALGWRGAFIGISIPIFIIGVIFYILLGRYESTGKSVHSTPDSYSESAPTRLSLRRLVPFIALGIAVVVLCISILAFMPLYMVDHFGVSEGKAAALLALAYSSGFWAGPLGGYLSDRFGRIPMMLVFGLVAGPIIYLLNLTFYGWPIFAVLIGLGMSQYITMPVAEAYIIDLTSERNRSTVLGIYFFGSRGGSGVMAPVMGFLIDRYGFNTSFTIIGFTMLGIAVICAILLWGVRARLASSSL